MDLMQAALLLFVVMDPLGNVPVFLSVLEPVPARRRYPVLIRELLIALAILFGFLLLGQYLLTLLGLEQAAIRVAGGLILFLISLKMIFPLPRQLRDEPDPSAADPFIVPLAVPLVAGPSALAVLLLMVTSEPGRLGHWSLALLLAWLASALILLAAPKLKLVLGSRGLIATERLMGMLLVALAVQMFLEGVAEFLGDRL